MKKVVAIARCNSCHKAHEIQTRMVKKELTVNFLCRCGNKVTGSYDTNNWSFTGAELDERKEGEPVFIHEPELKL